MSVTQSEFSAPGAVSKELFPVRPACVTSLLLQLLLLALPAAVQAQFIYTTNNGSITINGYTGPGDAVIVPDTINGLPVTRIGGSAFEGNTSLTSVTIPNGVTSIDSYVCAHCGSLASVALPNSVTNIGSFAFDGCTSLTSLTMPSSLIGIGGFAFYYCDSLTNLYFRGNAPESVGPFAFFGAGIAIVYYLPGTTGWGARFAGIPTVLWKPRVEIGDASFGVRTNRFGFTMTWADNRVVVVEASTNVANPAWIPVGTNTLNGGSSYFSDPQWINHPTRFYRLRSP